MTPPGDNVPVGRRSILDRLPNLIGQFRRRPLVSIQTEDPILGGMCHRIVPELSKAMKLLLKDLVSKFTNDLLSGIGAEIIHHHYLISPSDSFQTGSNIPLFVVRDDNRRDLPWIPGTRYQQNPVATRIGTLTRNAAHISLRYGMRNTPHRMRREQARSVREAERSRLQSSPSAHRGGD